jgi:hypothetical protein
MNLSNRSGLMHVLMELQTHYPNWRFGQLIANVADWANQNTWDVEDDQLLAAAEQHLQTLAEHKQEAGT